MLKFLDNYTIENLKDPEVLEELKDLFTAAGDLTGSLIVAYLKSGGPPQFTAALFKDVPAAIIHTLLSLPANLDDREASLKIAEERAMSMYLEKLGKEDFPGSC